MIFTRVALLLLLAGSSISTQAQAPVFGTDTDRGEAAQLWQQMLAMNLVGDSLIPTDLYKGVQPHGLILENLVAEATLDDHTGVLIVKRNYGPSGVDMSVVEADRVAALKAVTIMFNREEGYDPDNQNWFYAKYLPDGTLDKNPKDIELAGRVAKGGGPNGTDAGCIACHRAAPGGDFLFVTELVGM